MYIKKTYKPNCSYLSITNSFLQLFACSIIFARDGFICKNKNKQVFEFEQVIAFFSKQNFDKY